MQNVDQTKRMCAAIAMLCEKIMEPNLNNVILFAYFRKKRVFHTEYGVRNIQHGMAYETKIAYKTALILFT